MAQTSFVLKTPVRCYLNRFFKVAAMAALLVGLSAGCASKPRKLSPEAQAAAEERALARQQVAQLKQEQSQLQANAARNEREIMRLRNQARFIERQGLTNVAAGEVICEAGDCARGCEIIDRGEARLATAREMRQQADELEAEAMHMRSEAELLAMEARDLLASVVD